MGPTWRRNFVLSRVTAQPRPPGHEQAGRAIARITPSGPAESCRSPRSRSSADRERGDQRKRSRVARRTRLPKLAIDGNTDGQFEKKSVTHTAHEADPWWEVDLKTAGPVDRVVLWNRAGPTETRLNGYRVELLNEKREVVWKTEGKAVPKPSATHETSGARTVEFTSAFADFEQAGFPAADVLNADPKKKTGWGVGGATGKPHALTLVPAAGIDVPAGSRLVVTIDQTSPQANHTLGHFRLAVTDEAGVAESARLPAAVLARWHCATSGVTPSGPRSPIITFAGRAGDEGGSNAAK